MKPGGSRAKGAGFERLVARMVVEAARKVNPDLTQKDCYRTPLSGGHPYGDQADLVVSPRFAPSFPYLVECKHRRWWVLEKMFPPVKEVLEWMRSTADKCPQADERYGWPRTPAVIMRGQRTQIFIALPEAENELMRLRGVAHARIPGPGGTPWLVTGFNTWLTLLWVPDVAVKPPKRVRPSLFQTVQSR